MIETDQNKSIEQRLITVFGSDYQWDGPLPGDKMNATDIIRIYADIMKDSVEGIVGNLESLLSKLPDQEKHKQALELLDKMRLAIIDKNQHPKQ